MTIDQLMVVIWIFEAEKTAVKEQLERIIDQLPFDIYELLS